MKYRNSDFLWENLILRRCPETSEQAYNKLLCLDELAARRDPLEKLARYDPLQRPMLLRPLSKRRKRIVRMYWAFYNAEKRRKRGKT